MLWSGTNAIYAAHFQDYYSVRSAFAVAELPIGGFVELEVMDRK
jgi:hypothetical protein